MLEPLLSKLNDLRLVLASSSEQRANLLRRTKLKFEICPSNFEESLDPKEHTFSDFVEKTALGKAKEVWDRLVNNNSNNPDIVVGVDTMVAYNGRMYGKPKTREEAVQTMIELTQANLPHHVYTGVVIIYKGEITKFTEVTTVYFMKLTQEEILSYVETGQWMGKAGGYGLQGVASSFIKRIEGDVNNVIGLPLCRLTRELKQLLANQ